MVRRYDEPVEVRVEAGALPAPQAFRWRGRHYRVRAVQAHWRERRAWWRDLGEVDGPGRDAAAVPGQATERVVWRVEASAGTAAGGTWGVFELGSDAGPGPGSGSPSGSGSWLLLRAED